MDLMAKAFAILMILVVQIARLIFRFRREKRKNLDMVVPPRGLLGRLAISLGCWIGGIGVLALGQCPLLLLWWAAQKKPTARLLTSARLPGYRKLPAS